MSVNQGENTFLFNDKTMKIVGDGTKAHVVNTQDNSIAILICSKGSWSTNFTKNETARVHYLLYPPLIQYVLQAYAEDNLPEEKIFTKEEIKKMTKLSKSLTEYTNKPLNLWKKAFKDVLENLYVVFVNRNDPFTIILSPDGEEKIINPSYFDWNQFTNDKNDILTKVKL